MQLRIRTLLPICLFALSVQNTSAQTAPALSVTTPEQNQTFSFLAEDFLYQHFPFSDQDNAFLEYRKARNAKTLTLEEQERLLSELKGYPLNDYINSWNLYDAIQSDPEDLILLETAQEFIRSHKGEYIAERFGTDLSRLLAKNGNLEIPEKLYEGFEWNKTEPDIAARHETAELLAGRGDLQKAIGLLRNARNPHDAAFLTLSDAVLQKKPDEIRNIAAFYVQHQYFSDAQQFLRNYSSYPAEDIRAAFSSPASFAADHADGSAPDLVLLSVLARGYGKPDEAADIAEGSPGAFAEKDLPLLWNFLGLRTAVVQTPADAAGYFRRAGDAPADPGLSQPALVTDWRIRASLASGNWKETGLAIRHTASDTAALPEDRTYWLGRSELALGNRASGEALLRSITTRRTYYGKLACDALELPYPDEPARIAVTEEEVRPWMQNPGIIRAVLFRRLGLFAMAAREWNWALRSSTPEQRLAASEYARRIGFADRMISSADRLPPELFQSRYAFPSPSLKTVTAISNESGISVSWIYGIIRQESRFMTDVASGAGAKGLMQLLTPTAKWTAKRYGLGDENPDLSDPETNIRLGAHYLKYLNDRFSGQKVLATAGYNAGPGRSSTWQKRLFSAQEGAVFTELIPFTETRNYVKAVLSNAAEYQRLLDPDHPVRLSELLGTVSPPDL